MTQDHYTYRITWPPEDGEHVGLCVEFPSLSRLDKTPESALAGIRQAVAEVVRDMAGNGEKTPEAIADRACSGEFKVRIPPQAHRAPVIEAAEQGVSPSRPASAKLRA